MARPQRPDFYHSYHHVVIRGVDGLPIFNRPKKRKQFLARIKELRMEHDLSIYAIGFMDNHVHLFVRRNQHAMARFFQRLKARYTQWYNAEYDRTGTLYDGRYFSSLVDQDRYFQAVWVYVHHQGVKAGIYESPEDDPWCTAQCYRKGDERFDWIDWEEALEHLPVDEEDAERLKPNETVKQWLNEGLPIERHRDQNFIAGKPFLEKYMQIRKKQTRQGDRQESPMKWETLLKHAVVYFEMRIEEMVRKSKHRRINLVRCLLAWAGRRWCHLPVKEIGERLKVGESTVSEMIKRARIKHRDKLNGWETYLKKNQEPEI